MQFARQILFPPIRRSLGEGGFIVFFVNLQKQFISISAQDFSFALKKFISWGLIV
jgi:hypothetical protein